MNDIEKMHYEESPLKDLDFEDIIAYSPEADVSENNIKKVTAFQCGKCSFFDISQQIVEHHQTVHDQSFDSYTEEIIYVCSLCLGQFGTVENLRGHMIESHKCRPIKVEARDEKAEQIIIKTEKPESPSKVKQEQHDIKHRKTESLAKEISTSKGECDTNALPFLRIPFKDFKLVIRRNHVQKCSLVGCFYKFENKEKSDLHMKCHKEGTITEFKCSECGLLLDNWRRCSAHLWKYHRLVVGLLQCPLCSYVSSASIRVWQHMETHRNWRSKVLKIIEYKKEDKLPTASKTKYYAEKSCDICGRQFVSSKTLSKHVKSVHHKFRPFICNVCGLKTTRKSILSVHMRQHTGEKPHECKDCKFRTRDPSTLRTHEMRHKQDLRHKCPTCDSCFIQTSALKRHIRKNHPEQYEEISCQLCNYVTTKPEKLQVHIADHAKGLIVNNEDSTDGPRAKGHRKNLNNTEASSDCFLPLESVDSIPHVPAVDTGGVTIPAPPQSEDTQFPSFLNN